MTTPPRKETPRRFLDARLEPLKQALLHRADALEESSSRIMADASPHTALIASVFAGIAEEFRALAEELHHW